MKNHHHNGHVYPPSPNTRGMIHETIAVRAYDLWERYGQPADRADEIWLEAERELVAGRQDSRRDPVLPVSF